VISGKQLRVASIPADRLVKPPAAVELASTFTVASTTLADVTGLTFALPGAGTWSFEFELLITQATASSLVGLGINYTGTITRIVYNVWMASTTTVLRYGSGTSNNFAVVDATAHAAGGTLPARVAGSITVSTSGTLALRAQRSAATTTINAGSSGLLVQV